LTKSREVNILQIDLVAKERRDPGEVEMGVGSKSNLAFETTKKQDLTKEKDETKAGGDWKLSALTFNELQIEKGRITYINQ
jgi:hypothetical protein